MAEATLREVISQAVDKSEPTATIEPINTEPAKVEPAKVESAKVEPAKVEPVKAEPVKAEPAKVEPAKVEPPRGLRPPESWKPAIREQHWTKLPPAVQAEIYRRERQIDEALQHSAEARKGMEAFQGLTSQFQDLFEFEKMAPMQTIGNLLNISRTLRFAPAPAKAQMMAQIIQGFGVDVKSLDQALAMVVGGEDPNVQQAQVQSQAIEKALAKELAPMRDFMSGLQQQRAAAQQRSDAELQTEIETFANDPVNEYFPIVKDVMADIMEVGASRGQKISLQDAYKRAILAHNDLAGQFTQQQIAAQALKLSAPATQALQKAGLSVTGAPSGETPPASGLNLRSDIEAAVSKHSGRQ